MECCPGGDAYEAEFSSGFAQRTARRYVRRGLGRVPRRMVDFLESRGVTGASVLEIGGGVGYLSVELLRRGAAMASNLDLSPNYQDQARALVTRYGLEGRMTSRQVDLATDPEAAPPADVVIFHRVVCCYPNYRALLSSAGSHARSALVFSYPTNHALNRVVLRLETWSRVVRRNDFRGFIHQPAAMFEVLERAGMRLAMQRHGLVWSIAGFERVSA